VSTILRTESLSAGNLVATVGTVRPGQTRRAKTPRKGSQWRTVDGIDNAAGLCRVRFADGTHAVCLFDDLWHAAD
jgi:hypothetical protein